MTGMVAVPAFSSTMASRAKSAGGEPRVSLSTMPTLVLARATVAFTALCGSRSSRNV
jgi:hypothetical protein